MEKDKLKEILIELLKEESYGACDIETWVDTHGIVFKPMVTYDELEKRVEFFINRNEKVKKYCI
jgi:hypothetical protein